uniref:Solute carrier organic anion transporter family member 1C1-like n=1 Tax=Salarias fasciatus TaxID=181472 RepID=A0A672HNX4_SALFA
MHCFFSTGNLLVIAFVSYFGSKFHRPRLIGAGCLVMAAGSFITALPHFFQDLHTNHKENLLFLSCFFNRDAKCTVSSVLSACEKAIGSSMWIYVFLGNMLRGIGETPIMPLGLSYLDDFASEENTPFYIGQTVGIIGPIGGFLLGSYLSKIYVDVGFVDLDEVTITYKDSRWVGAWWLGFIVTGLIITLSSIPFWFLPKSIRKEDMGPSLKRLFSNKVYMLLVLTSLIAVNGFIGMITFKPKYMEQVFGQASSRAIFLIGTEIRIMNLPAVALGIIGGGLLLKKMKLGVVGAARLAMTSSILSCCLLILQAFIRCNQAEVAGLTVSYQGNQTLLSQCNSGCSCSLKQWDPVCAHNGMTYVSPCLAGCQSSSGASKDLVYHNCSCIGELMTPSPNMSVVLGQCPRKDDCNRMFKVYMALSVTGSFISAFGGTSSYIADLKSFALGMQTLIVRTLGGIPPPIYFGALIDQTCLKWGTKQCGGVGACRLYDSHAFRLRFMGLVSGLYVLANVTWGALYTQIVKKQKRLAQADGVAANGVACDGAAANGAAANGHAMITVGLDADMIEKESTI